MHNRKPARYPVIILALLAALVGCASTAKVTSATSNPSSAEVAAAEAYLLAHHGDKVNWPGQGTDATWGRYIVLQRVTKQMRSENLTSVDLILLGLNDQGKGAQKTVNVLKPVDAPVGAYIGYKPVEEFFLITVKAVPGIDGVDPSAAPSNSSAS